MNPTLNSLVAIVAAYSVGSLSFAVIVSRAMGLDDPRSYGSGNPGATNVLRSGNRAAAILTLALDALKGYVPVLLALMLRPACGLGETTVALRRAGGVRRPPVAGVLPLQGRQGRGHRGRRAARLQPAGWARPRWLTWVIIAAFLPLFVAGVDRGGAVRAVLPVADLGRGADRAGDRRDEPAADLAPQRQHPKLLRRHREQLGQKAAPPAAPPRHHGPHHGPPQGSNR